MAHAGEAALESWTRGQTSAGWRRRACASTAATDGESATALESFADLREAEARRLQQLIERRASLLTDLTAVQAKQARGGTVAFTEHPA